MAYRGEDLDLRTPHTRGSPPVDTTGNGLRRSDYLDPGRPILVDEIVLAVCNYAHEVATAHRSAEVRLDHLVYALTRIEGSIPVLEDRGARVSALRNEASSLAAAVPQSVGILSPRKSDDLESVLRYASDLAQRRSHAAATVEDLLIALVDLTPDHPAIVVLRRHMPRRLRDTGYVPVRPEAPPLIRNPEPERERTRVRATTMPMPETRIVTEQILGSATDSIQNSRIDTLEQALRQLSSQLTSERKSMSVQLQDIQRDVGVRRDEDLRSGGGLTDRIAAIEVGIDQRLADLSHMIAGLQSGGRDVGGRRDEDLRYAIGERIGAIEASLEQRLGDLARAIHGLQDRLQALDTSIHRRPATMASVDLAPLQDRIANIERIVQTAAGDTSRGWATVADRIKTMEASFMAQGGQGFDISTLTERLATIERVLQDGSAGYVDTSSISNRLEGLEQQLLERLSEPGGDVSVVAEKLKALETGLTEQRGETRRLVGTLSEEVGRVQGAVRETSEAADRRIVSLVGTAFERQRAELAGQIGERGGANPQLTQLGERLGALERNLTQTAQKIVEQSTGYDQDLGELQDVLIKLHGNQQSISTAIEQWRQQGHTELGVIGNRLSAIERVAVRPAQMMESMNTRIDALYRLNTEKIERRNRFVYWLFGTNDWLAASWPERRRAANPPSQS